VDDSYARKFWMALEPLHAVTYFSPECVAANKQVGLRGFWMGYFGSRGAPLGPAAPGVIEATFFGFHPARVRRAIPDAWGFAPPDQILAVRAATAAGALRRLAPGVAEVAETANPMLVRVVEAADPAGRPLFAANRDLGWPEDPVEALWQAATSLREHRGDGHVALLVAEGLNGCQANVLACAVGNVGAQLMLDARGWSREDWDSAVAELADRGLVDDQGQATAAGHALRESIEERTDALAEAPYRAIEDPGALHGLLKPVALAVAESGEMPYPNPIGLPPPD
jgi:hypothetical protein